MNDRKRLIKELEKLIKSFDEKQIKTQQELAPRKTVIQDCKREIDE